jgi:hypothetical protein
MSLPKQVLVTRAVVTLLQMEYPKIPTGVFLLRFTYLPDYVLSLDHQTTTETEFK